MILYKMWTQNYRFYRFTCGKSISASAMIIIVPGKRLVQCVDDRIDTKQNTTKHLFSNQTFLLRNIQQIISA